MVVALSLIVIAAAWVLLLLQVDPVPTWFYVFVWYPTLLLLDRLASRLLGSAPLLHSGRRAVSLFAWSAVIWLLFEAANLRLRNWYYVFLPRVPAERWAGILLSFATVVPALVLAARVLDGIGIGRGWRTRGVATRPWHLHAATLTGLATAVLALAFPRVFFPLVWGAVWLLVDPYVYRRRPEWSLLKDIERGEWGRPGRLMLGGLAIGLLWEFYNFWARGKWIYTVPWLDYTKLFEMPPLGFVGFPLFALEAWALYHALCAAGVGVPLTGEARHSPRRVVPTVALAVVFVAAVLTSMERWTISSTVPRLAEIPGISSDAAARLSASGIATPFRLARHSATAVAERTGLAPTAARDLVESSRLVTLRGIGTRHAATLHALDVRTVCALARRQPIPLWRAVQTRGGDPPPGSTRSSLTAPPGDRPTPAEVRVWIGAARRTCASRYLLSETR
jgi:hypothetical protein